jgi:hypothetical protein
MCFIPGSSGFTWSTMVDRFKSISAAAPMVTASPQPTVTQSLRAFKDTLLTWALTGLACTPPLFVMLHPGTNQLAHQLIQDDFELNTPGLKWYGLPVIPSWTLYRHVGPRSGGIHTGSGFDQTVIKEGDEFTLASGGTVKVNSGHHEIDGPRNVPGGSTYHRGVDLPLPVGTPLYAPVAGTKVQCWWDDGGGGQVATLWVGPEKYQALHLQKGGCKSGTFDQGEVIGYTGDTGRGTGPHLHWEQVVHGVKPPPKRGMLQAVLDPSKAPVYQAYAGPTELDDAMLLCIIGRAEGTANDDCSPNRNYYGHGDGGRLNLGFTSSINGYGTPEASDQAELAKLRQAAPQFQQQAMEKFGKPLSPAALAMVLDMKNQSPDAANRLMKHLPSADPTPQEIIAARTAALTESRQEVGTGTAPNLNVGKDQARRVKEGLGAMERFRQLRQENRDK